jgi:nitroreductase
MNPTPTQDAIEVRKSTRTFQKRPITSANLDKISAYLRRPENSVGPFGHQVRFELVIETEQRGRDKIGTYGFIKNPQGYILGSSTKETQSLFDYAFVLENIVLYLTTLGIGTCWLGGRFRKQEAMSHLSLAEHEIIPAITPIGYPQERRRLKERMVRTILQAKKRKREDQLFFYERFGQPLGDRSGEFRQALHYVRVGPSAQNKQPWRLVFSTDLSQVHFYIASALADHPLYMCEPEYLDIGIAYNHFKAGLDEAGISGNLVTAEPDIERPDGSFYITSWYRDHQR